MKDPAYDRITLLVVTFDSGFNSKSTVERFLQQIIGKSPTEYKSALKKERPSYHLAPYCQADPVVSTVILFYEAIRWWIFTPFA
jgi:hypothetical protein